MIIWDTGEYEVLPYHIADSLPGTDDSRSDSSEHGLSTGEIVSESAKLQEAFRNVSATLQFYLVYKHNMILRLDVPAQNPATAARNTASKKLYNSPVHG